MNQIIAQALYVVFMLSLIGCGLHENEIPIDVVPPQGLQFISSSKLEIQFTITNKHPRLKGYNVYFSEDGSKSELRSAHNSHVVDQKIDKTTRNKYIIPSKDNTYPTISIYDFPAQESTIRYTLERTPTKGEVSGNYCVAVSAMLSFKNLESELSNIICTTDAVPEDEADAEDNLIVTQ